MAPQHAFLWERGTMRDLGTLGGDCSTSHADAINDKGEIVGAAGGYAHCSYHDHSERAVLWYGGRVHRLGSTGAATDINSSGDVLIAASSLAGAGYIVKRGTLVPLPLPRGWKWGGAVDLNEHGQVVGDGESEANGMLRIHAFVWQNGQARDLGTLPGWRISRAVAVNDEGTVAGNAFPDYAAELKDDNPGPDALGHAVAWREGGIRDLGTLGGKASRALAIDAAGRIVGWSQTRHGVRHAFVWQDGRLQDLGTLSGRADSEAVAINVHGVVIGNTFTLTASGAHALHAFVWQSGTLIGLDPLAGGKESGAIAINDHNQIIGWSTTKDGRSHAVVWTRGTR